MKNGLPRLISILVGGTENIMSFDMRQCGIILVNNGCILLLLRSDILVKNKIVRDIQMEKMS